MRMPIRGRKDPVELDSRKLPGKVTAGGTAGVNPGRLRPDRARHAGAAVSLARRARTARRRRASRRCPCMSIMNMPPLAYLRRIPGLDCRHAQARLHRRQRVGQLRSRAHHAVQPRPAGDPPAGGEGQRAAGHAADQLQGRALQGRQGHTRMLRPAREGHRRGALRHAGGQDRTAGQAARSTTRCSCRSPSGRCCWPGNYRCVTKDGMRTAQEAVHTDIETSRSVYNFVVRPLRQARRQPGRPGAVREVRRGGAEPGAAGFGRARAATTACPTSSGPTSWCS